MLLSALLLFFFYFYTQEQLDNISQSFATGGRLEERGGEKVVICLRLRFEFCNCMSVIATHFQLCFLSATFELRKVIRKRNWGKYAGI